MTKVLHLKKAIIRNFRSIEKIDNINNIGDVAVFVGANESGKSNILKALNWFGTDESMEDNDIPVEFLCKNEDILMKKPIVEVYFEILVEKSLKIK